MQKQTSVFAKFVLHEKPDWSRADVCCYVVIWSPIFKAVSRYENNLGCIAIWHTDSERASKGLTSGEITGSLLSELHCNRRLARELLESDHSLKMTEQGCHAHPLNLYFGLNARQPKTVALSLKSLTARLAFSQKHWQSVSREEVVLYFLFQIHLHSCYVIIYE